MSCLCSEEGRTALTRVGSRERRHSLICPFLPSQIFPTSINQNLLRLKRERERERERETLGKELAWEVYPSLREQDNKVPLFVPVFLLSYVDDQ